MENLVSDQSENTIVQPAIKQGWLRMILFLVAVIVAMNIGGIIGLIAISIISGVNIQELMQDPSSIVLNIGIWSFLVENIIGLLFVLLTVWLFRKFVDRRSMMSLGFAFKNYKFDFISGMLWGVALISAGFAILWLLGLLTIESIEFIPLTILGYVIFFFVVSLNEEIMVRGYMLNNLSDSVNKYSALLITSVLFGAMHLMNANMSFLGFVNIVLAGILLGIYYIHKQNLWFPIGIHFTWNLFQGPVLGFEVSGIKTETMITQNISGNELLTGGEFGFEASLLATVLMIFAILAIENKFRKRRLETSI